METTTQLRVTLEQYKRMSPDERLDLLKKRTVTDLSTVDPDFLARANADARQAWVERQSEDSTR